ncbi:39S ribosomal protein L10, mitochondrial [Elysia marginata]|uniref:Large ribosomal subunit protein uL10m n=1 Tax=Elysia marginata TaxID=1093978 RepID=A0AAV4JHP9_9GAST|nr:39S ribosomal protein L10, mitochondrial [Elysia marginata]
MGVKTNIQKPRMPWIERRILNAVTVPLLPPDLRPLPQKCQEEKQAKENACRSELQEAYEAFRTKDTWHMLSQNKMVAICHILPMTSRDFFNVRVKVHNAGMKLKFANNKWARSVTVMFIMHAQSKRAGGLVEDRILSRAGMQDAAKLPPLDIMRGELLTILSASAGKTSRLLGRHQTELSANLAQLVKQQSEGYGDVDSAGQDKDAPQAAAVEDGGSNSTGEEKES